MSRHPPDLLELTVVVPTHARERAVERLLQRMLRQDFAGGFEVIVSIDGSDDGTEEVVRRQGRLLPVRSIRSPRGGRARACNAGARIARGRVLLLLDDDMEPADGFLSAHANAHPLGSARAVVGPAPIHVPDSAPAIVRYRARNFDRKLARLAGARDQLRITDFYTGNFSVPLEAFLSVGGFDETFTRYGHEDFELLLRLRERGVTLGFAPDAVATQRYDKTFADLARDTVQEGYTAVLFAEKHPAFARDVQLSAFSHRRRCHRRLYSAVRRMTRHWRSFPAGVSRLASSLEHIRSPRLTSFYDLAFEYFYWVGIEEALAERGQTYDRWLAALSSAPSA